MPSHRSGQRSVLIGSLLLVGVVTVSLLVFFAPAISRRLQPSIEVVALLDDAAALTRESPVWIAGRPVGEVLAVELRGVQTDSTERVAVRMRVPRKHARQVRLDSEVRVTSGRLIGEPVLDILPGSAAAPPVGDRDSLRQRPGGSWTGLMQRAEALDASFNLFFADLEAFKPPAAARAADLERLDRQLNASSASFRELQAALDRSPLHTGDPGWQQRLDRLGASARELGNALHTASQRAARAHQQARPALAALAARADTVAAILAALQASTTENGGGFLVRSQRDSAIVKRLQRARQELDSLVAETKRNPLRFWF